MISIFIILYLFWLLKNIRKQQEEIEKRKREEAEKLKAAEKVIFITKIWDIF